MATILITGATSGIGEALASLCAKAGHTVIACGRNEQKLAELAQIENISTCRFDVTDEEATKAALANIKCDMAVLNAGTCEYVEINDVEPDMFKRVFDANVFGVINVVSALIPVLKRGNKIVFVDSLARLLPFPKSQAYGASKAALNYIAKSFEVDLAHKGIQVQTLTPGFVKTPLTDKNDFPMPMVISAEAAAKYMLKGIFSSRSNVYFPRRFSFIVRLLNFLPEGLQKRICIKMRQQPKIKRENA
ncbi:SDR family NAD(P)-dependent oxidoreductase [Brumicola pallidula]|jgi:NAD(P)-dependent dehydrogenase (short-subunit alcohol dehydrogenase family)|uniref:Serine 3-dehydrogenase n=1 Tax=Brumicola pallidula DSM 14239 = ACAM 615 TaxID=1121922 RepID=K7A009_9ALTE|nr:SDR family NAD(P)-dependent oxidoreductase [Glaciecola pallidula]GAC28840.1 serine 3-dehydrogenase [Glaciecola pallidula DSM 14239 = ACAM 615]